MSRIPAACDARAAAVDVLRRHFQRCVAVPVNLGKQTLSIRHRRGFDYQPITPQISGR